MKKQNLVFDLVKGLFAGKETNVDIALVPLRNNVKIDVTFDFQPDDFVLWKSEHGWDIIRYSQVLENQNIDFSEIFAVVIYDKQSKIPASTSDLSINKDNDFVKTGNFEKIEDFDFLSKVITLLKNKNTFTLSDKSEDEEQPEETELLTIVNDKFFIWELFFVHDVDTFLLEFDD